MWSKLLTLGGILLIVAACETAPEETADGSGGGAGAGSSEAVSSDNGAGGGAGAGTEMVAVEPAMSLQEILVQEVGDRVFFDYDQSTVRPDGEETLR